MITHLEHQISNKGLRDYLENNLINSVCKHQMNSEITQKSLQQVIDGTGAI